MFDSVLGLILGEIVFVKLRTVAQEVLLNAKWLFIRTNQ